VWPFKRGKGWRRRKGIEEVNNCKRGATNETESKQSKTAKGQSQKGRGEDKIRQSAKRHVKVDNAECGDLRSKNVRARAMEIAVGGENQRSRPEGAKKIKERLFWMKSGW